MENRLARGAVGAAVGVLPGAGLVLLAQFVITGELQLTVGAAGIVLAAIGLVVGYAIRADRPRP
jgi:hypothetical protein